MKDNEFARLENNFIYMLMGLITFVFSVLQEGGFHKLQCFVLIYYIITIVFEHRIYKSSKVSDVAHAKLCVTLMIVSAIFFGVISKNSVIYLVCLFVPAFVLIMYLDYKLLLFTGKITLFQLTIIWILGFPGMSGRPGFLEIILFYLGYIIIDWMLILFAKKLEFKERQAYEQERSLDDMLKVVSVKCDEARAATKSKSMFLSNMSHEIRTPLNAILGMNEIILRDSNDEDIIKNAMNIESSGRMLLSLINDILDFSKIEAGKMELVNVEYQVGSVLNDLINMIQPRAKEKNLKLEVEVDSKIPSVLYGDEVRVKQITTNLLTNAVKYTQKGMIKLIVKYSVINEAFIELYIGVKDTGIGIKAEDQKKLFDSFKRVALETNRNIEGSGLGLTITKRFVDMMGGSIHLESEKDKGSLFYVKVKQKVVSKEPIGDFKNQFNQYVEPRKLSKVSFIAPNAKLLVVDDNEMNLQVVKGLLRFAKMQIDTAISGKECLEKLRQNQYHIIFLDHMMPEMDGIETLDNIHKENLAKDVPIIALTANAVSGAREMYFKCGFQDYLSKPISGANLEKMVKRWLPVEFLKEKVSFPKFIDEAEALKYSPDGTEGILFNIRLFVENEVETRKNLMSAYEAKDWKKYQISSHSLKTTAATIGDMSLSSFAKKLETEAKEVNEAYILDKHDKFLCKYKEHFEELQNLLSKE